MTSSRGGPSDAASCRSGAGRPRLVLATRNAGKVREIRAIYAGLAVDLIGLDARPDLPVLPEEGNTYAENAASKAVTAARITGCPSLADDSGVEIDALEGAPGVRSARFLGDAASDAERNAAVLSALAGLPAWRRTARYRAVVAIATPEGRVWTFEGVCDGTITEHPRGNGGFGYDPIFEITEDGRTMAEVPLAVKNELSHRARALGAARPVVERVLGLLRSRAGAGGEDRCGAGANSGGALPPGGSSK